MSKHIALKQGLFDKETMTVRFGGPLSKSEFLFTAKAIHCPKYSEKRLEREDAGGGWYGEKVLVTKVYDRNYLIVRDGVCIGVMYNPYIIGIKSKLHPINDKTPKSIKAFFDSLKIPYQHYVSNKTPFAHKP